jgi:hypothetical protein
VILKAIYTNALEQTSTKKTLHNNALPPHRLTHTPTHTHTHIPINSSLRTTITLQIAPTNSSLDRDGRVLCRLARLRTVGQALDHVVRVAAVEEGD